MPSSRRFLNLVLLVGLAIGISGCCSEGTGLRPLSMPAPASPMHREAPREGTFLVAGAPTLHFTSAPGEITYSRGDLAAPLPPEPVSPSTAFCYACLVPGGGHFYTGETMRGAALLGVAGGSLLAGALLSSRGGTCTPTAPGDGCEYDHETHQYRSESSDFTPLYVGAAVAAGSWIYGIVDARNSAARVNARNGVALGPLTTHPVPLFGVALDGRTEVGVRLRLAR